MARGGAPPRLASVRRVMKRAQQERTGATSGRPSGVGLGTVLNLSTVRSCSVPVNRPGRRMLEPLRRGRAHHQRFPVWLLLAHLAHSLLPLKMREPRAISSCADRQLRPAVSRMASPALEEDSDRPLSSERGSGR